MSIRLGWVAGSLGMAELAWASIVSPSMCVLTKLNGLQRRVSFAKLVGSIISAALEIDGWVASTSTFWAAVRDAVNLGGVIKLRIKLAVEISIAHCSLRGVTLLPARNLVINVKVLCATFLLDTLQATTVRSEHLRTVHIASIFIISKVVLIVESSAFVDALVVSTVESHPAIVPACNRWPVTTCSLMLHALEGGIKSLVVLPAL
jgi:hypothetical protein